MVITLDSELESTLKEVARQQGVAPEKMALDVLRKRFLGSEVEMQPQDDWERNLLEVAKDCGVSLSDDAVSREGLYE